MERDRRSPEPPDTPHGATTAGDTRGPRRWTMRFTLRVFGVVTLAVVVVMALCGAYVIDFDDAQGEFVTYWTVFFFLLLGVIVLAMLDAALTMVRFRKEHERLRREFGRKKQA
ncbi:MAG: hypothetical protein Kow0099_37770 [Candidatus Abyssubacteria bacterium]